MLRTPLRAPLRALKCMLAFSLLAGCFSAAVAATAPTLFTVTSGKAEVLAQGVQQSWPIKIDENSAMDAVFKGGMWLSNPAGGRIYAKYERHIVHANGTWTWVGKVETVHGDQQVVLTFGKDGVFGLIPQASGYPLRIATRAGQTRVIATSAEAMARSPKALRLHSGPDFVIPPRVRNGKDVRSNSMYAAADVPVRAAAAGPVTIDVMVAYTPGFVSELGSQSLALTRIQSLVDLTNQTYLASGVNQQIRLVHTVEVDYTDNNSNQTALDELSGVNESGTPVQIPAALQGIAGLRTQYGADLVALMRSFDSTTQAGCGIGWLVGGDQAPIVPSQAKDYGYSVVSDGTSDDGNGQSSYCLDTTFAHELGHNMGDAHDRDNAGGKSGAYSYSYGYKSASSTGFATIMAYPGADQDPVAVFSNPNISTCKNSPCGVADGAADAADNAHSMNQTGALIAQFMPTEVGGTSTTPTTHAHNDVNGDGKSDLLWYNAPAGQMTSWLMNGATRTSSQQSSVPSGYQPIATGDFDGNGAADILWKSQAGEMYLWLGDGSAFTSQDVSTFPAGWIIAGTGDINADGKTDLFWYNKGTGLFSYWLMNGATLTRWQAYQTSAGLQSVAAGDFDGNGSTDIIWKTPAGAMYMWLFTSSGTFNYYSIRPYPKGWVPAGTGDVDQDGKSDLYWYNPTSGQMTYWLMNGTTLTSWHGYRTNAGLTPLSTGLFDGSHAGIVWKTTSGAMYMWLFNGSALSYYSLGSNPAGSVAIP